MTSTLGAYRTLVRLVGPAYVLIAFVGRIPLAMSQLGTLLLVSSETGRYGLGGAAAGALAVANALGSPIAGGLTDRIGQRPVVLVQSLLGALGLVAIVMTARSGSPAAVVIGVAALTGLCLPQVGPLARVRWRPAAAGRDDTDRLVDTAFSYEGAADEASFVLGPALVGVLALIAAPTAGLLAAGALLAVFGTWFAIHPTAPPVVRRADAPPSGPIWTLAFVILMTVQFSIGALFGSVQTGTTALATAEGQAGVAGLIHAALGVGSVIAGLAIAALPAEILYATRLRLATLALVTLALPLLVVDSLLPLALVIAVLGFAVAPTMISAFALAGVLGPQQRIGTAMTYLAGATGTGYAVGAAIAGRLADEGGHGPAFAVTVGAAALCAAVAWAGFRALRDAAPVDPVPLENPAR